MNQFNNAQPERAGNRREEGMSPHGLAAALPPGALSSLLAAVVESANDAIITENLDGVITSWNRAAEKIFGYTAAEAIGRSIAILISPDRQDEEPAILQKIKQGETINHYETTRRRKEGAFVDISLTVSPIKDVDGKVLGASKIARDITDRRRSQERLRRSEERFRVTLASIGDAVIATDVRGVVNFMNAVAESLTGWTQGEAFGRALEEVFRIEKEGGGGAVENPVTKVIREGTIVGLANHTVLIAKNGVVRPIDDSAAPIRDSNGELIGVVLVFRDVTERRMSDLAMQRLAAIVESSQDAIIAKNLDGIITHWNRGAERIFGYTEAEALGRSITMLIPLDRRSEETMILSRIRRGERVETYETVRVAKSGRELDVSLTISPVRDSDGEIVGASKIARDVTAQKQARREIEEAQKQLRAYAEELEQRVQERTSKLQQSMAELEAFSYSISHDLRAPLRAMQQYSQLLLDEYSSRLDEDGRHSLSRIARSASRLDRLIQDVLTYSGVARGAVHIENLDLEESILAAIEDYPKLQSPETELEIQRPLPTVKANSALVMQCLSNLLINAVKFVPPGRKPRIRIWAESKDVVVRLWIEDNGIGIDPKYHDRIFRMFERLHSEEEVEGTGIGLAIVRKAAERMGGAVGVESTPGQGSKFWIELPKNNS